MIINEATPRTTHFDLMQVYEDLRDAVTTRSEISVAVINHMLDSTSMDAGLNEVLHSLDVI